jgi:FkbM family methyltransferase
MKSLGQVLKERLVKCIKNLNKPGKYIEMGASDGLLQSNTSWLQFEYDWSGILIEPSSAFAHIESNRPNNLYFNCACVSFNYKDSTIAGDFDGELMGSVGGRRLNRPAIHTTPARTLQSILDDSTFGDVDFFSLDTEGYEMNVLKGVDFSKQKIHQILIEVTANLYGASLEDICDFMYSQNYSLADDVDYGAGIGCVSGFTREGTPGWDGTHNDYLFNLNI